MGLVTVYMEDSFFMKLCLTILISLLMIACNGSGSDDSSSSSGGTATSYTVNADTTWQLQLQGTYNLSYPVNLYELDLFDVTTEQITELKNSGKTLVCYFSAGSYENWRSDASSFPSSVIGDALSGWAGENWLDIRSDSVKAIMLQRLQLAKSKGCDAVDPDNMDGYQQTTGFSLTATDQLTYNTYLATEAHHLGLSIGLKNDLLQASDLEPYFDFAVNEQCVAYQECDYLSAFKNSNKLIINIEYDSSLIASDAAKLNLCTEADYAGMKTKVMTLALDGTVLYSCF